MNKKPVPKAAIVPPADPIPKPTAVQPRLDTPRDVICQRCGWEWETQMKSDPRVCPRCKSYAWKVPRPLDSDEF